MSEFDETIYKPYGIDNIGMGDGITITTGFDVSAQLPLDTRTVVRTIADLHAIPQDVIYMGLLVYVIEDNKLYQWKRVLQEDKTEKIEWGPIEAEVSAIELDSLKEENIEEGLLKITDEIDFENTPALMMQKNKDNFFPITHKEFVYNNEGISLAEELNEYQKKELAAEEADKLLTENKTIIGAINELNSSLDNAISDFREEMSTTIQDSKDAIAQMKAENEAAMNQMKSELDADIKEVLSNLDKKAEELDNTITNLEASTKERIDAMLQDVDNSILSDAQVKYLMNQINANINAIGIDAIKQIACGYNYTYILKNDNSVWACGYNDYGRLGLGTSDDYVHSVFTKVTTNVKQISCGYNHAFILKNDGSVWSCGRNLYGQLGLGDTTDRYTFTQVTTNINNDVEQVICGYYKTFILKNDGSLWSCGYNGSGQLGLGYADDYAHSTFTQVTTNVKQISCDDYHAAIVKNDGSLWTCGINNDGELGFDDVNMRYEFSQVTININNDVKQVACGNYHIVILKTDGSVWVSGRCSDGQSGLGTTSKKLVFTQITTNINNDVEQVICAGSHTFILKNDSSLWATGRNNYGQLGLGDTDNRNAFTQATTNVKQIDCGEDHAFILKNDGSLWSCGRNDYGQLGLNDTANRNTFTIIPKEHY